MKYNFVAPLVKPRKMKSTMISFFIFAINFRNETESNWRFRRNEKTCLQNKKSYLIPPSRHGHFYPISILPAKMVELPQQHVNATVHWLYTLPLSIVAKSSILNVAEFLGPSWKTSPCTKTSPVSFENQSSLFILFRNVATLSKVIVFFSGTFYSTMKYFWSAF